MPSLLIDLVETDLLGFPRSRGTMRSGMSRTICGSGEIGTVLKAHSSLRPGLAGAAWFSHSGPQHPQPLNSLKRECQSSMTLCVSDRRKADLFAWTSVLRAKLLVSKESEQHCTLPAYQAQKRSPGILLTFFSSASTAAARARVVAINVCFWASDCSEASRLITNRFAAISGIATIRVNSIRRTRIAASISALTSTIQRHGPQNGLFRLANFLAGDTSLHKPTTALNRSWSPSILLALRAAHGHEFFQSPPALFRQSKRVRFVRRASLSKVRQALHGPLKCRADPLVG